MAAPFPHRISYVGNTCNYAYLYAKFSRQQAGPSAARAFIEETWVERDQPWWDDPEVSRDALPEWVARIPMSRLGGAFGGNASRNALGAIKEGAGVHAFGAIASLWALRSGRPYVYQSYGDIATTPYVEPRRPVTSGVRALLARRAIAGAKRIVLSQAYDYPFAHRQGLLDRVSWLPIAYDCGRVQRAHVVIPPALAERFGRHGVVFYVPSRQEQFKRQDKVLMAFADFVRERKFGRLVLGDWGEAVAARRQQIRDLHIEEHVEWVPCLPKAELMQMLALPDLVVLDEFEDPPLLMSPGGVSRDALAMEANLISRFDLGGATQLFTAPPPYLTTDHRTESILIRMKEFADMAPADRAALGRAGREWLVREHEPQTLLQRYFDVYEQLGF